MRKQINEPDFIGGHGALNKEEEMALSKYFTEKKTKTIRKTNNRQTISSGKRQVISQ